MPLGTTAHDGAGASRRHGPRSTTSRLTRLLPRHRRDRAGEGGFTILEVAVAFGVMLGVLALLAQNLTSGFSSIVLGRNREVATGIANKVVEQVRAMAFEDVVMANADLAVAAAGADPAVTVTGSGVDAVYSFRGRAIPRAELAGATAISPHRETTTPGRSATAFTRSAYVTESPDANPATRLLTVRVSWSPAGSTTNPFVEVETLVFSQTCEAQSGPRPCESYWYSKGDAPAGSIRVHGSIAGQPAVDLTLSLAGRDSLALTEQFSTVHSAATLPGVVLSAGAQPAQQVAGDLASAAADDDLTSALPDYHAPAPVGPGGGTGTSIAGQLDPLSTATLSGSVGAGSTASAVAAAVAAGQTPPDGGGPIHQDSLPTGRATSRQGGTASVSLALHTLLGDLGLASLVSADAPPSSGTATADRSPGTDAATTGDDSAAGTASRTLGRVRLGGLPALALPGLGWQGHLVDLTGYSASASASAGPGAASDPAVTRAGTLSFWNGTGYTSVDLSTGTVDTAVSASAGALGCTFTLDGNVQGGGSTTEHTHEGGGSSGAVLTARAAVHSPLVVNLTYHVACGALVLADLTIDIDLGSTVAEARYALPTS